MLTQILLAIVLLANLIGFAAIGYDKWRAKTDGWRVSEFALVVPAALGGWLGVLAGMRTFRHKTQKRSFHVKLGIGMALSLALTYLIMPHL